MSNTGLVYIFTGEGKGKTSAALGAMVRGLGNGWQVGWVSLYKEAQWKLSELEFIKLLTSEAKTRLTIKLMGKGFYLKDQETPDKKIKTAKVNDAIVVDDDLPDIHEKAAQYALQEVERMLESKRYQLVIIDEVCNAIDDQLLTDHQVMEVLNKRGSTHIVVTGRFASKLLVEQADLVSSLTKIKHPFDQGQNAIKGLDF